MPTTLQPESPTEVQSVWIEPPTCRPPAIAVPWAPPPMLVQQVPPRPFDGAQWIGGYWIWQRGWLWAMGLWSAVPMPGAVWVHPSYERRQGLVLFVAGHWADPASAGAADASVRGPIAQIARASSSANPGVIATGPEGSFIPASPGSEAGVIVPAPRGTPPAVMCGVPPLIAPGARVLADARPLAGATGYRVSAPGSCTRSGRALDLHVPAQAHLAAALRSPAPAWAPRPRSELTLRHVARSREAQAAAKQAGSPVRSGREPALRASA